MPTHTARSPVPPFFALPEIAFREYVRRPRDAFIGFFSVLCVLLLLATAAHAQSEDFIGAGTLYLRSDATDVVQAPRLHTDVTMKVTGIIARVQVRQRFQNSSDNWVEGLYAFPLPENSAVDRMRMEVGERVTIGEIREKVEAQKLYEQARESGQHASVVHQSRPNLFRTAVANIGPGQTVAITIEYLEIIEQQAGRYSMRFPLTITPRYIPGVTVDQGAVVTDETPVAALTAAVSPHDTAVLGDLQPTLIAPDTSSQSVSFDVDIDAGVALKDVASTYHAVKVDTHDRRTHVRLTSERVAPDHDFELAWTPQVHGEPAAALFHERTEDGDHVLLMVMPPQEDMRVSTPREVIFVIDTSGSMEGESIRQARAALLKGLASLKPTDRFSIIQFNSIFDCLFAQPVSATPDNLATARHYVAALRATGGTEMLPALSAAFAMEASGEHLRQIVFMTDGAVGNEEQLMQTIRAKLGDARLFTIGIGSAPNAAFMRKAAQMGRGTFTYIGSIDEVDQKMSALLQKLTSPVLTDIELHWPSNAAVEYAPAQVRDLYLGEPVVVVARVQGEVKGMLAITGHSSGVWMRQIPLHDVQGREGVATLWARNRIEDLLDARASGVSPDEIRSQVLPIALRYQLVTDYTSLVAVDHTPARPASEGLDSQRVPNTLPQGSAWPVATYPKTATPAELHLIVGLCLLLAAAVLFMNERRRVRS